MKVINAKDFPLPEFPLDIVGRCKQGHNVVTIESFGLTKDDHEGFLDGHGPVEPFVPGRSIVRGGRKDQIVYRWKIVGWQFVKRASIFIYRWHQDRPVGFELVRAAEARIETYGTVAGVRLTQADLEALNNNVFSADAGPYMARIQIDEVKPDTQVIVPARRTYFDILPIAVIGAGAAGLRVASYLLDQNDSVLLLEARDASGAVPTRWIQTRAVPSIWAVSGCTPRWKIRGCRMRRMARSHMTRSRRLSCVASRSRTMTR
jgi:hypothetical protein